MEWDAQAHQSAWASLMGDTSAASAPARAAGGAGGGAQGLRMKEKKEREQEEARRRAVRAEKAEKEKKRADALRQLEIWSEADNLLKRGSDFLCKMKFFNTLPDLPVEPRLLDVQWPLERLAAYAPSSLERDYKHETLLGPNLGVAVDLVNPSAYLLPAPGAVPPLAPEDAALLVAEKETLAKRERRGASRAPLVVPWLRKSEFITAVFDENLYNQSIGGGDAESAAALRSASGAAAALQRFADASVREVCRQFDKANDGSVPKHPKNPALQAVSVQLLGPNPDLLARSLTHVLYEEPPAAETADWAAERREVVLTPYMVHGRATYVRTLPDAADDVDALFGAEEEEQQAAPLYHKTLGYAFKTIGDTTGKFFVVWEPERLSYVPITVKLELHDLARDFRGTMPYIQSRYRVAKRELVDDEVQLMGREKFARFMAQEEEEEEQEEAELLEAQQQNQQQQQQQQQLADEDGGGVPEVDLKELDYADVPE